MSFICLNKIMVVRVMHACFEWENVWSCNFQFTQPIKQKRKYCMTSVHDQMFCLKKTQVLCVEPSRMHLNNPHNQDYTYFDTFCIRLTHGLSLVTRKKSILMTWGNPREDECEFFQEKLCKCGTHISHSRTYSFKAFPCQNNSKTSWLTINI